MNLPSTRYDVLAVAGIGIAIMIWAIAKLIGVNEDIGGDEVWTYVFIGAGTVGIGLIIWQAISAIREGR